MSDKDTRRKCAELYEKNEKCEYRIQRNKEKLDENALFHDMIQGKCETLNGKILSVRDLFRGELEKATEKLSNNVNENNMELNETIRLARKEIERLKGDLTDILE